MSNGKIMRRGLRRSAPASTVAMPAPAPSPPLPPPPPPTEVYDCRHGPDWSWRPVRAESREHAAARYCGRDVMGGEQGDMVEVRHAGQTRVVLVYPRMEGVLVDDRGVVACETSFATRAALERACDRGQEIDLLTERPFRFTATSQNLVSRRRPK